MDNVKKSVRENENKTKVNSESNILKNGLEETASENEEIIMNNRKGIGLLEVREEIKRNDYTMEKEKEKLNKWTELIIKDAGLRSMRVKYKEENSS